MAATVGVCRVRLMDRKHTTPDGAMFSRLLQSSRKTSLQLICRWKE